MPRAMFTEMVSPPSGSRRKWYAIPLSLVVHAGIFALLIVVPLLATGELPIPASLMPSYFVTQVIPSPPPEAPMRRPARNTRVADVDAAPLVAPDRVGPESGVLPDESLVHTGGIDNLVEGIGTELVIEHAPPPPPVPPTTTPARAGVDIKAPERIRYVPPVYPVVARANRIEGIVVIEAIIGVDGKVDHARVTRSTAFLDEAALEAVKAWEYTPTLLNGRPTAVIITVTVQFRLN